jgi:hypothetical protein
MREWQKPVSGGQGAGRPTTISQADSLVAGQLSYNIQSLASNRTILEGKSVAVAGIQGGDNAKESHTGTLERVRR